VPGGCQRSAVLPEVRDGRPGGFSSSWAAPCHTLMQTSWCRLPDMKVEVESELPQKHRSCTCLNKAAALQGPQGQGQGSKQVRAGSESALQCIRQGLNCHILGGQYKEQRGPLDFLSPDLSATHRQVMSAQHAGGRHRLPPAGHRCCSGPRCGSVKHWASALHQQGLG